MRVIFIAIPGETNCVASWTFRTVSAPSTGWLSSECLVRAQVAPLAHRQIAQLDAPDAHALQADHLQSHHVAHAADLALLAFLKAPCL